MIVAALILSLLPERIVVPRVTGPYQVQFVAFDQSGAPLYTRQGWVYLGPPETLGTHEPPPDDIVVQDVDISVRLTTVQEAEKCQQPQSETYVEVGRRMYFCGGTQ